jgi:hypothetical protein
MGKKNLLVKHYNNPQCFVRKATMFFLYDLALLVIVILNQLHIKKIKLTKIILEKIIKKTKTKTLWGK